MMAPSPSSTAIGAYVRNMDKFCRCCAVHVSTDMLIHLSDILESMFWNADNMYALYCFMRRLFLQESLSPSNSYYLPYDRATKIVRQSTLIGGGEQGQVFLVKVKDLFFMVLKCAPSSEPDLAHEFAIGSLGTNRLRHFIPNFAYVFPIYREGAYECLFIERIRGKTWHEVINLASHVDPISFLRLWAQVLCALEIAQDRLGFCHFDLHRYNIMVRESASTIDYVYVLSCREYKILGMREIATFIDYGHSCIRYKGKYLGMGKYPEHGMMDFMVPGQDIFRLCSNTWCQGCPDPKIQAFFDFVMMDFYKIPEEEVRTGRHRLCKQWNFPNAITVSDYASYTPAMLLRWLVKHRDRVCEIIGIHPSDFPVRENLRTRYRFDTPSPSAFSKDEMSKRYQTCLDKYPSVRKDPSMMRYLRRVFVSGTSDADASEFRYPESIPLPKIPHIDFLKTPYVADPMVIHAFRKEYSVRNIIRFKKRVEALLDGYYRSTEGSTVNPHAAFLSTPYVRFFCRNVITLNRILRYEDFLQGKKRSSK